MFLGPTPDEQLVVRMKGGLGRTNTPKKQSDILMSRIGRLNDTAMDDTTHSDEQRPPPRRMVKKASLRRMGWPLREEKARQQVAERIFLQQRLQTAEAAKETFETRLQQAMAQRASLQQKLQTSEDAWWSSVTSGMC